MNTTPEALDTLLDNLVDGIAGWFGTDEGSDVLAPYVDALGAPAYDDPDLDDETIDRERFRYHLLAEIDAAALLIRVNSVELRKYSMVPVAAEPVTALETVAAETDEMFTVTWSMNHHGDDSRRRRPQGTRHPA